MSTFDPRRTPWTIDESEFWEIDGTRAQREFLLRYAVLAPSGHNTQPWTFRITPEGIEVQADFTRRLPVADPSDRELLMSIGAAIFNLRVAAAHFGFESTVLYGDTPLVTLRETCNPDPQLRRLFPAITKRRTSRAEFEPRELEPEALDVMCEIVESTEMLHFIVPHDRQRLAELVEEADLALMANDHWRSELADWVRPNESSAGDGLSADVFGIPGPLSALAPHLIRSVNAGPIVSRHDRTLAEQASGLVIITGDDDAVALIRVGETLERFLLTLTNVGIQYGFLNQACQVPALRQQLWDLVRTPKPPQLLLRVGYGKDARRPMPRRPVELVTT